jgi:hypothetical protein
MELSGLIFGLNLLVFMNFGTFLSWLERLATPSRFIICCDVLISKKPIPATPSRSGILIFSARPASFRGVSP